MIETPVPIAGGGPVGMTLALELAHHGVSSILVESNATTTRHPKSIRRPASSQVGSR